MDQISQALNFNGYVFLGQIVLFLVLLQVMTGLFWKPVLSHLKQRDYDIDQKYQQREVIQQEMEALRADYLTRIAIVEADARKHIQDAIKEAQAERERLISEARENAESSIRQNLSEMEQEKIVSLKELRGRMVVMALDAAESALASTVDRSTLQGILEQRVAG